MMRQSLFDALNIDAGYDLIVDPDVTYDVGYVNDDTELVNIPAGESVHLYHETVAVETDSLVSDSPMVRVEYDDGTSQIISLSDGPSEEFTAVKPVKAYRFLAEVDPAPPAGYYEFHSSRNVKGVFDALVKLTESEETPPEYLSSEMDLDYLMDHSGTKAVSNLIWLLLRKYGNDVEDIPCIKTLRMTDLYTIAGVILRNHRATWDAIYNALTTEYAPLENYSMIEEETPDLLDTHGVTNGYQKTHTQTNKSKVKTKNTGTTTDTEVYGFNSATAVPESSMTVGGEVEVSADPADNIITDIDTQVGGETVAHTGKKTLTRSGNIGTVTSQSMLDAEIKLRLEQEMEHIIFRCVDEELTTAGYMPILSKKINVI